MGQDWTFEQVEKAIRGEDGSPGGDFDDFDEISEERHMNNLAQITDRSIMSKRNELKVGTK